MPTINQLPRLDSLASGDQLPVYATAQGDSRRMSVELLQDYMQDNLQIPTDSSEINYSPGVSGAVDRTAQSKMREIVTSADSGSAEKVVVEYINGTNGDNVTVWPVANSIASDLSASTISGGGNTANPQLIGFLEYRDRFNGDGATNTWTTTFSVTSSSNVRVRLIRSDKVRVTITSYCTITIVGGYAQVLYPQPGHFVNDATGGAEGTNPYVLSTQQIEIVGITAAENIGSASNYSGIYGGYDNIIQSGVMQHIIGAHHRIVNGDHNTIVGGSYGRIESGATYSAIIGGTANEISISGTGSAIVGGNGNTIATLGPSWIYGGSTNTSSGAYAFTGGGFNNVVSGNGAFVGGRENTVSGRDALVGGYDNTVSGVYSVSGGLFNTSSGAYSTSTGRDNVAAAESSVAFGRYANATLVGALTVGAGRFSTAGDAQTSIVPLRVQTTNATTTTMLAQSGALTISSNTTWAFRALISCRRIDGGSQESGAYEIVGAIKNDAGTTALLGTPTVTTLGEDDAVWNVTATANNTTDTLQIQVTGAASKTINWVCRLELSEVTG